MKQLLLIAALLLAGLGHRAVAQPAPPTPTPGAGRPAARLVDSAAVLHQLFQRSRRFGALSSGLVGSNSLSSGLIALYSQSKTQRVVGGIAVGSGAGLLTIAIVDLLKYSRRREREAFEQLRAHRPLRPYVQRTYTLALLSTRKPRR